MNLQSSPPAGVSTRPLGTPPDERAIEARVAREWPLVGRVEELEYLEGCLGESSPDIILLSGPAGVGKSRLAEEIAARARTRGWSVEWVQATEASAGISFGAVSRWVRAPAAEPMSTVDRLAQLHEFLALRSRVAPLLVVVDDVDLLDAATATLLQQVGMDQRIRLLMTIRGGKPVSPAIRSLWRGPRVQRVEVQPLELNQINELLGHALGGPIDHPSLAVLWRLCTGNVLVLRELVLGGLRCRDLHSLQGVWHWRGGTPISPSVHELIATRLGDLTARQRETLELIAVGEPMPEAVLVQGGYDRPVGQLERAGLVRWVARPNDGASDVQQLVLAHPLFGESIRTLMPALSARRARRSLAAAVCDAELRPPGWELRASVWLLDAGDVPPADILVAAAARAGAMASHTLQERLARAGCDAYGGFRFALLLAQSLLCQARWIEAERWCRTPPLADANAPDRRCEVAAVRAEALARGMGRSAEAMDLLGSMPTERAGIAGVHCAALRGAIAMFCSDLTGAVQASDEVLAQPGLGGELIVRGMICAIPALTLMGRTADAARTAKRGRAVLENDATVPAVWHADLVCGQVNALRYGGRWRQAVDVATEFYQRAGDMGLTASALGALALGQALHDAGRITQALPYLREATSFLRQEDTIGLLPWALCSLAQALAVIGQHERAAELAGSVDADSSVAPIYRPEIMRSQSWVAAAQGEFTTAAELCRQSARLSAELGQVAVEARAWHDLARMGKPAAAAAALADLAQRTQSDEPGLFRDHAQALRSSDARGLDAIAERFSTAGDALRAAEAATVAWSVHRATGHRALAEQSRLNALRWAAECDGDTTPALRRNPTTASMSRRETEVAAMARRGMTNVEIAQALHVSVRTVEGHLQRVFDKLGVHHRSELPIAP